MDPVSAQRSSWEPGVGRSEVLSPCQLLWREGKRKEGGSWSMAQAIIMGRLSKEKHVWLVPLREIPFFSRSLGESPLRLMIPVRKHGRRSHASRRPQEGDGASRDFGNGVIVPILGGKILLVQR